MLTCLITHRGKTVVVVVDGTKAGNIQGKDTSFFIQAVGCCNFYCLSYPSTKLQEVARENGINEKMLVSQHSVEERKLNPRRKPLTRFYLIYVLIAITNSFNKRQTSQFDQKFIKIQKLNLLTWILIFADFVSFLVVLS